MVWASYTIALLSCYKRYRCEFIQQTRLACFRSPMRIDVGIVRIGDQAHTLETITEECARKLCTSFSNVFRFPTPVLLRI
jgi:flagellar motor switch protein FliM